MNTQEKPAVAVVGAGIAGIQASLDLAHSGFHVYLIEEDISIGGVMAKLDKTFPTNDCSTCMISPRFLEVKAHPNIEILTRTEVLSLEGEEGNFTLRIRSHPRFVDESRCTACGQCTRVCPIAVPDRFNQELVERRAVYRHFPQAVPSAYAVDKRGMAPCKAACPAGISIEGFIALIRQGLYDEALRLIKRDNPLAATCGHICPHPCETACYRGLQDDPIAIEKLKRFVADRDLFSETPYVPEKKPSTGKRVAVVGAGLTAAYYLAVEGHEVVVFEAMEKPGGLLRYGIPSFRLDRAVVDREIEVIERLGVVFRTGMAWGRDFTLATLREEGFDAILVAVGAQQPIALGIPGEHLPQVYHGISFLRAVSRGEPFAVGKRVVVIGGGSVAIDVALTARRLGAEEVRILYRRSEAEMPVVWEDLEEVKEEGIAIEYLTGCIEILGDDREGVRGVRCIRMRLGEPDESGRRRPIPCEDGIFEMEADTVFSAIGQQANLTVIEGEPEETWLTLARWGTIAVDPHTYGTSVPGIFAAGDAEMGPSTVVLAVASAKEAARAIHHFLTGEEVRWYRSSSLSVVEKPFRVKPRKRRVAYRKIPLVQRLQSFDELFLGFTEEEAREEAGRCLECGVCAECYRCEEVCLANAVNLRMVSQERELTVRGLVLATGFTHFDPLAKPEYGYKRYANVLTSLEFERMLAASGPTGGEIRSPKDGSHPKKIAWIQCVGSRDASIGREYCSGVCCMYAMKQAMVARDHDPALEATIFFIDVRAMGKGFERYYERAVSQYGVRFVKSSISRIVEAPQGGAVEVSYVNEHNQPYTETFDLVVLSVGAVPPPHSAALARKLGLETDAYGFVVTDPFDPVQSTRKGVVVCGMASGPKDIPDSVVQACSASASLQRLHGVGETLSLTETSQADASALPLSPEDARIGVFICHCGINIAGVVDVRAVAAYARELANVVVAEDLLFACASDGTKRIEEAVREARLNRVVVASCSPRTHEPLFRDVLKRAGINKYLFEMANIRDQCSWVHGSDPLRATEKAKHLVKMAVAKARLLEPLEEHYLPVEQSALVLGGGPAGMTAALHLASQGYSVTLVECSERLGGNALQWQFVHYSGANTHDHVRALIRDVMNHERITVFLGSEVVAFDGRPGAFVVTFQRGPRKETRTVGTVIVATGAEEYRGGQEYLRSQSDRIFSQREFHRAMVVRDDRLRDVRRVVMIQCVGSRSDEHPYCSRVCCTMAVSNAIRYKELYPDAHVTVLYRDIRTFGTKELLYYRARTMGVRFLRFDVASPPEVVRVDTETDLPLHGSPLAVNVYDNVLERALTIPADAVILSTGIVPPRGNRELSRLLKLSLDADGFFMEAHIKLKPLDTATPGVFICGLAHGPKFFDECLDQAKGAASRASVFLRQRYLTVGGSISVVNPERCSRCLCCVRTCPYGAPSIVERNGKATAFIDPARCQGCGACAVACPAQAIELALFTDGQLRAKVRAGLREDR